MPTRSRICRYGGMARTSAPMRITDSNHRTIYPIQDGKGGSEAKLAYQRASGSGGAITQTYLQRTVKLGLAEAPATPSGVSRSGLVAGPRHWPAPAVLLGSSPVLAALPPWAGKITQLTDCYRFVPKRSVRR
jgi:hypothetical protein